MKKQLVRELPFGASPLPSGATRFRFWEPAQTDVGLEVEGLPAATMRPVGEGWFEAELPCGAGTPYRYRLASGLAVQVVQRHFAPLRVKRIHPHLDFGIRNKHRPPHWIENIAAG